MSNDDLMRWATEHSTKGNAGDAAMLGQLQHLLTTTRDVAAVLEEFTRGVHTGKFGPEARIAGELTGAAAKRLREALDPRRVLAPEWLRAPVVDGTLDERAVRHEGHAADLLAAKGGES